MQKKFIMTIDQGTTGTTLSLLDAANVRVCSVDEDFAQIYPKPGWVEHDPEVIWQGVVRLFAQLLKKAKIKPEAIAAIGITNQRETTVAWNKKTGQPAMNAIVWQCRRTQAQTATLQKKNLETKVQKSTGLVLDPYFSATKIRWILDNSATAKKWAAKQELAVGTIDSFLIYRLTGGAVHATDASNASRTSLLSLKLGGWDPAMLKLFQVPAEILPEVRPSFGSFGQTSQRFFPVAGIPITGVLGDQQAALLGQAAVVPGQAKCTFGTGSFILLNVGTKIPKIPKGLLATIAWQETGGKITYALEGGAFVCGAAVQWLRDQLKLIKESSDIEALAREVDNAEGVFFIPALAGLGSPHWEPNARGILGGLTRGSGPAHIARAVLEGLAQQNADILEAMKAAHELKTLRVDGGATANNLLMQLQADFLGVPVERAQDLESTTRGAAMAAQLGLSSTKTLSTLGKKQKINRRFLPKLSASGRAFARAHWQFLVKTHCLTTKKH